MAINTQILVLVLAAALAGIFAVRIFTVLGRRTGTEREPSQSFPRTAVAVPQPQPAAALAPADPAARGLMDIKLADKAFETDAFISGARQAYEIVVTAFARNDRMALRPLLSDDVYAVFDGAMRTREERGEKTDFTFVGFKDVKITHAVLKDRMAEIAVDFAAQFTASTTDASGKLVDGDPKAVRDVLDSWTFTRDVKGGNPNWTLTATAGPEAI